MKSQVIFKFLRFHFLCFSLRNPKNLFQHFPAFAASTSPHQGIANVTNDDFKAQAITWDLPSTTGIFANTFEKDGIRWYLKGLQKSQKDIGLAITKVYEYKDCNWGLLAPFFNLKNFFSSMIEIFVPRTLSLFVQQRPLTIWLKTDRPPLDKCTQKASSGSSL
ncbi:antimicrobial peptide LCI [Bacillus sp. LBG-1-113]|nr:antimicrobial peptide LCI [Bacillus sp. LBG-1-113]